MTGFILAFGLIYECFSYGVYAPAMYLAFLIPLLGGLLPSLILWSGIKGHRRGRIGADPGEDADAGTMAGLRQKGGHGVGRAISSLTRSIWDAAVLTLTLGSLMSGVLAIYGTSNRLILAYWLAAGGLTALALFSLPGSEGKENPGCLPVSVESLLPESGPGRQKGSREPGIRLGTGGLTLPNRLIRMGSIHKTFINAIDWKFYERNKAGAKEGEEEEVGNCL